MALSMPQSGILSGCQVVAAFGGLSHLTEQQYFSLSTFHYF
jgi:hypothetical protein